MASLLQSLLDALRGLRSRLPVYRIERSSTAPVDARALAAAIMGAGFRVVERWRALEVARVDGDDLAIVRLRRSRVAGARPLEIRASDRDLVLGLMTAMSAVLGTIRLRTPDLGEVVVSPPTDAASPDTQRAWDAVPRKRVASHYALGDGRRRRDGS